jgi:hypothetical protein
VLPCAEQATKERITAHPNIEWNPTDRAFMVAISRLAFVRSNP